MALYKDIIGITIANLFIYVKKGGVDNTIDRIILKIKMEKRFSPF
jgi:hypothetical protein